MIEMNFEKNCFKILIQFYNTLGLNLFHFQNNIYPPSEQFGSKMSNCINKFYFPIKRLKTSFVAMKSGDKPLVLTCYITFVPTFSHALSDGLL